MPAEMSSRAGSIEAVKSTFSRQAVLTASAACDDPRADRFSGVLRTTPTAYTTRGYLSVLIWPTPPSRALRAVTSLLAPSPSQTGRLHECLQAQISLHEPVFRLRSGRRPDPCSDIRRCGKEPVQAGGPAYPTLDCCVLIGIESQTSCPSRNLSNSTIKSRMRTSAINSLGVCPANASSGETLRQVE
jgi:hypothetical protein